MWGRLSGKRANISIALISAALISSCLLSPTAQAQMRVRPSTVWGHTFSGSATETTTVNSTKSSPVGKLEKLTTFVPTYNSIPNWARTEVQSALNTWSANFKSIADINVTITWAKSENVDVLGSARPGSYFAGFTGAPDSTLWYPSALANALAGKDLDRNNPEIIIQLNSSATWNQRGDDQPRTSEYDLESVILHEIAHGLGFLSTDVYDKFFKYGSIDQPPPFDAYLQTTDGRRLADLPTPSLELGTALVSPLFWIGENAKRVNGDTAIKMYTPNTYELGSSISHLDENTFAKSGIDAVMTPNLDAGEVFHQPGPLLLAMMEDLRAKPPVGLAISTPDAPRNVSAIIANESAIITFEAPANARAAQVTSYSVRNLKTSIVTTGISSPILVSGLKNGSSYTFAVTAINRLGTSPEVVTKEISPQTGWKKLATDLTPDGKDLAATTFNGKPIIFFTDPTKGDLKIALWNGSVWKKTTVDGAGGSNGRTKNKISGHISLCTEGTGTNQKLHIFYPDATDLDLRYAIYDGKTFKFEIVDGNAANIQSYEIADRVRTGSDVSVSNACAVTSGGISVFYRDESQGILLGATKRVNSTTWVYELVDGDTKDNGRTTGDVAFHLASLVKGNTTHLIYDSVLVLNQRRETTSGEVRYATRTGVRGNSWSYQSLDQPNSQITVAGYDVAIAKEKNDIRLVWIASAGNRLVQPNQIRSSFISKLSAISTFLVDGYGLPGAQLNLENGELIFNCQLRLCSIKLAEGSSTVRLASSTQTTEMSTSAWVNIDTKRYLLATQNKKIIFLIPQLIK
jgi:hypothetical protein